MGKRQRKRKRRAEHTSYVKIIAIIAALCLTAVGYGSYRNGSLDPIEGFLRMAEEGSGQWYEDAPKHVSSLSELPQYDGQPYVIVEDNKPSFDKEEAEADPYESYSRLDKLGRCGYAQAKLAAELMPDGERGYIGSVEPSGWQQARYEGIDGESLYNRCHLIGYQLAGENANEKNLITGTRYMNVEGMLPFENLVADYIRETDHSVLYRVTPIYEEDNLVASGVEMEAESVEDDEICFHVYVFNVQPGIWIDYRTGESRKE